MLVYIYIASWVTRLVGIDPLLRNRNSVGGLESVLENAPQVGCFFQADTDTDEIWVHPKGRGPGKLCVVCEDDIWGTQGKVGTEARAFGGVYSVVKGHGLGLVLKDNG